MDEKQDEIQQDATQEEHAQTDKPHGDDAARHETDWKAEARKWEQRAKENRDAANAAKVDSERLAELERRLSEAEQRNAQMEQEKAELEWRRAASEATGVPADVLRGATAEEVMEHARAIKAVGFSYPAQHEPHNAAKPSASKDEILAIKDSAKRLEAIRANIDLFK